MSSKRLDPLLPLESSTGSSQPSPLPEKETAIDAATLIRRAKRGIWAARLARFGIVCLAVAGFMLSRDKTLPAGMGLLFATGAAWVVLVTRTAKNQQDLLRVPGWIENGQLDRADAAIGRMLTRFSLAVRPRLLALRQAAMSRSARRAQGDARHLALAALAYRSPKAVSDGLQLIIAEAALDAGDLLGAHTALSALAAPLSMRDSLKLLELQTDYCIRVGAWPHAAHDLPGKVDLAELLPADSAALVQAMLALAARHGGLATWATWLAPPGRSCSSTPKRSSTAGRCWPNYSPARRRPRHNPQSLERRVQLRGAIRDAAVDRRFPAAPSSQGEVPPAAVDVDDERRFRRAPRRNQRAVPRMVSGRGHGGDIPGRRVPICIFSCPGHRPIAHLRCPIEGRRIMSTEHAEIEMLEARRLLAAAALTTANVPYAGGTMLQITGTAGADTITLSYDGSAFTVKTAAGFSKTLPGVFTAVRIDGMAGDDRITVGANIWTPCFLFGEEGTDTLKGGSGDDSLFGGAGTNYLYGMTGRDTLVSVGGNANDALAGGAGEDIFWTDNASTEKIYDADAYEAAHTVNKVTRFASTRIGSSTQAIPSTLLGQRLADPTPTSKAYVYKRFDNRPLFAAAGPTADDVQQGQTGDCYLTSTLAAAATVTPDNIRGMVGDLGDGTYAVRFEASNGASTFYRVDNDLAVYNANSTTPAYAGLGVNGSVWVAIVEKAFAFARRNQGSYDSLNTGWMNEGLTAIGLLKNSQTIWKDDAASADDFLNKIQARLAAGDVTTVAVYNQNDAANLVGGHAYTVVRINKLSNGTRQLVLRNPWAIDGYRVTDGKNDGYITLTAASAFAGLDAIVSAHA